MHGRYIKLNANWCFYAELDFYVVSRVALAGLKDCTVTRGLKNTPPSAAVENIGQ